jgi:hypothetical protein
MIKMLTWRELRDLPVGTLLVFPEPGYDIYPHCFVHPGTLAIVASVDTVNNIIDVLPASTMICEALKEWSGCISFSPHNDGYAWDDESPVALTAPALHKATDE